MPNAASPIHFFGFKEQHQGCEPRKALVNQSLADRTVECRRENVGKRDKFSFKTVVDMNAEVSNCAGRSEVNLPLSERLVHI